jgi:acyl carrier protein
MSEVREKLFGILANYSQATPEEMAKANTFEDLGIDSVAVIAVLDEVEETFGIKFVEEPDQSTITLTGFAEMIQALVDAKGA